MSIPHLEIDDIPGLSIDPQTRACMKLWAAVFNLGLHDVHAASKRIDPTEFHIANHWFHSRQNVGPGSFIWLCELFGLDPDKARRLAVSGLNDMEEKKNARLDSIRKAKARDAVEEIVPDTDGLPEGDTHIPAAGRNDPVAVCDCL